jgi:hypothetical protein
MRERSYPIDVSASPTKVDPHVAAIGPTRIRKCLSERRVATLPLRIVFVERHEHADVPHGPAARAPRAATPPRRQEA